MTLKHQNRIILGVILGNLIEAFDMAICGLLSVFLAKYLMGNSQNSLMIVFLTFFIGYLARPIGAFTLGLFSDVYGRKITLAISILAMGISTSAIGLIPSYESFGKYSMFLLLALRMIQSFSCGVEYLNSSAYLVENAKKANKGFSGSWASFGSTAGLLSASFVTLIVSTILQHHPEMESYIWRFPFILALLGSSIGLYIRLFLPESLEFIIFYAEQDKPKITKVFKQATKYCLVNKIKSLHVFCLSCLGVTATFLFYIYAPTQAHFYGLMNDQQIIIANICALLVLLLIFPLAGRLSDKMSSDKLVIIASIGFLLFSKIFFQGLVSANFSYFLVSQCLISIPSGIYYATVPVMLTNLFPIHLRCTVLSVIYALAASLSAGLTPVISLMLLQKSHNPSSPALIMYALIFITLSTLALKNLHNFLQLETPQGDESRGF
jgi:MHS family proline/betaine transporter-like MFS transporter